MWIIKLGGSLADSPDLIEWLKISERSGAGKIVIVPGGGPFADQVRQVQKHLGICDETAHKMALLAMDQYGLMLADLLSEQTLNLKIVPSTSITALQTALNKHLVPVWLPARQLMYNREIPQNWTATSDSLAAWLAGELQADQLFLIKRVQADEKDYRFEQLESQGIVDTSLKDFARSKMFQTRWLSADQFLWMDSMLKTNKPEGACIL